MSNLFAAILFFSSILVLPAQNFLIQDDFEGNGNIDSWYGDDCDLNTSFPNPFRNSINTSTHVLKYHDVGGQWANVGFDLSSNFDLREKSSFSLKVYIPSNGLTGNAPHQISLKLQDGRLDAPWITQSEIIKPLLLDQWQEVSFDFASDPYINLDPTSLPPTQREDFNRVLLQLNGENNNDQVLAYIDDMQYEGSVPAPPVFDQLVWADEFEVDGPIDNSKWHPQTLFPNGNSWFNGEIQHYTDRPDNAYVENGVLKIVAKRENYSHQGISKNFTSARLNSKFAFRYGKVEVRAKLPTGAGTWPAIWMLGKNITERGAYWETQGFGTTPWPACGEIDIMEHWGTNQNYVSSALHTPSSFGSTVNVGGQSIPTVSTAFHIYTLEWTAEKMIFKVDGNTHLIYDPPVKDANTWPFDLEQFILLNVAVLPSIAPSFSSSAMEIDYVRVYQESPLSTAASLQAPRIALYPNPFREKLSISLSEPISEAAYIHLYDFSGKLIRSYELPAYSQELQLSQLAELQKGFYLLKLDYGTLSQSFPLMKVEH